MAEPLTPRRRRAVRTWWRTYRAWVIVALVAVAAGATGLAGAGRLHPVRGERFDAKQITIRPSGEFGVRVREVIDVDFGRHSRHGFRREITADLGTPTDVRAGSPDANAELHTELVGDHLDVRIGSAAETFSGQHRYVLEYTYPDALRDGDSLALDIIDSGDVLDTARLDVVVTGFEFSATYCDVGAEYTHGGCELARDGATWRAVLTGLVAGDGVTIAGDGARRTDAVDVALPPAPERPSSFPRPVALVLAAAAVVPVVVLRLFARWFGTNKVRRGGPTEAAFADAVATLAEPPAGQPRNDVPTYRVPDSRLDELATIEFAPPSGLRAWHGVLAVNEAIDAESVTAWFSDLIAAEALVVVSSGAGYVRLRRGPRLDQQSDRDRRIVDDLFGDRDDVTLSGTDPRAVDAWFAVMRLQAEFARESGWWRRNPPTAAERRSPIRINPYWVSIVGVHVFVIGLILLRGQFWTMLGAILRAPVVVLSPPVVAVAVTFVAAAWAYAKPSQRGWPARSAAGSAAALRTLSFQRFLDRSEGQHVQWAWEQGRLREYSAWAVALGASDAWGQAVESTDVTPGVEFAGVPPDLAGLRTAFDELDVDVRPHREPYDNPWPRYLKAWARGSSGGSGRSGGSRSSSRSGSRGVGGGGGGGRSGTW